MRNLTIFLLSGALWGSYQYKKLDGPVTLLSAPGPYSKSQVSVNMKVMTAEELASKKRLFFGFGAFMWSALALRVIYLIGSRSSQPA